MIPVITTPFAGLRGFAAGAGSSGACDRPALVDRLLCHVRGRKSGDDGSYDLRALVEREDPLDPRSLAPEGRGDAGSPAA